MKNYEFIKESVFTFRKGHSQAWVLGYIYGLLDWRVISMETYNKLVIYVSDYFNDKPVRFYNNKGDKISP